jgi:hypothetical protein
VQLPGDAVPFPQHRQFLTALVEPRVDQRDRRVRRQQVHQFGVGGGEPARRAGVGQEQSAEDLVAVDDRHAEKVGEFRVGVGPPAELRMGAYVRESDRARVAQHHAEQAVLARQRTDRGPLLVADPVDEELGEPALGVRHPEGGVPGVEQPPGGGDDRLQHLAYGPARGHRENRLADLA